MFSMPGQNSKYQYQSTTVNSIEKKFDDEKNCSEILLNVLL